MTDTSEEAARRRAAEQLSAATAAMVTQGNIEAERAEAEKRAKKEAKKKVGGWVGVVCVGSCIEMHVTRGQANGLQGASTK